MAGIQQVSFTSPYAADEMAIQRRQKLAEILAKEAIDPLQTNRMAGRFVVPVSPWEGIAKLGKAGASVYLGNQAEERAKKLSEDYRTGLVAALQEYNRGKTGTTAQTIQPDPQEAQQSADYGTPPVGPVNVPAQAPNPQGAVMGGMTSQYPELKQLATLDYTQMNKPLHFADTGKAIQGLDTHTGLPIGPAVAKAVSPNTEFTQVQQNARFGGVSGNTQATLAQAQKHFDTLSPYQQAQLEMEARKVGISGQQLLLHRIQVDPFNQYNTSGIGGGGVGGGGAAAPNTGRPGTPNANANTGLSGDEYLKTLPPAVASQVKEMAEGRLPITGMSMRNPQTTALINMASQYEPGFDATIWKRRNETATAFSKGRQGDAVRNANQALDHAAQMEKNINTLDNPGGIATAANYAVNPAQRYLLSDPRQGNLAQTTQALSSEMRKLFSGSGGGSLTELESWEKSFPQNAGKEAQLSHLRNGIHLMSGGLNALNDQYRRGMGPNRDVMELLSPTAKATFQRFMGGGSDIQSQADAILSGKR